MQITEITEQDAVWLVEQANDLLASWSWPVDPVRLASHFRRSCSQTQTWMLCELLELRARAKSKFSRASEMFFHRRGLEQSTDECIASYKAARYRGAPQVIDLCCGLGGDAMGLSQECLQLTLVDSSAPTVVFAQENVKLLGTARIEASVANVHDVNLRPYSHWHLDPDRRPRGPRRSDPAKCEPPLPEFLEADGLSPNGAIKLAPAATVNPFLSLGAELEWIGHGRECQQQVAWFGECARHPGKRCATWIDQQGTSTTLVECGNPRPPTARGVGRYLLEPKPSVLAAGLAESLAAQWNLSTFADRVAYFTTDDPISSALMSAYEVLGDLAFHRRALATFLKSQDARVLDVKKRGVAIDPARVRHDFKGLCGKQCVVLVFYPRGASIRVAVVRSL